MARRRRKRIFYLWRLGIVCPRAYYVSRIRQSFVRCFVCHVMVLPYKQRLALIWMYYTSSMRSVSGESVIQGMITSCKRSIRKLLHFGNLESRCGFSYDGLPIWSDVCRVWWVNFGEKWSSDWGSIECGVVVVSRFYVSSVAPFFGCYRMLALWLCRHL